MVDAAVLEVSGIEKSFSGVHALSGVSLALYPGRVHCLAGENGSGKSTLIKIISGVETPDAGTITLDGRAYRALTPRAAIRHGVQIIYQDLSLFPNLTLAENIAITSVLSSGRQIYRPAQARRLAEEVLARIDISLPLDRLAGDVSVAQRQLAAICRALAQDARVLFMDEPTTALTEHEVDLLFKVVEILREQGVSIVFVSHKFNEVLRISDEITVLRNGAVVAEGPVSEFDRASLSTAMTGREVTALAARDDTAPVGSRVVLSVEHASVAGRLSDLNLQLREGEILGVTGLLGSGRTAVAEAVFGVHPIDHGIVRVDGEPRVIHNVRAAIDAGIGYVPGDRLSEGLFLNLSVGENIIAASSESIPRRAGLVLKSAMHAVAEPLAKRFRIKAASARQLVRMLSGGNQQRVVLAKWFIREPKILILNGPTVGVDVGSKREIMSLLRELAVHGTAIIVISDDVSELVQVTDRLIVMKGGRVHSELDRSEITEERILHELAA